MELSAMCHRLAKVFRLVELRPLHGANIRVGGKTFKSYLNICPEACNVERGGGWRSNTSPPPPPPPPQNAVPPPLPKGAAKAGSFHMNK